MIERIANRSLHLIQRIITAVIGSIRRRIGADDTDPHRIEPGIYDFPDSLCISGIRIDIDLSFSGFRTNLLDSCCNIISCQRRFSLTALSKANDAVWRR